jgi:hypothetical protein
MPGDAATLSSSIGWMLAASKRMERHLVPAHFWLIGRYGNGAAALVFALFTLVSLDRGRRGLTAALISLCLLAAFNSYAFGWMTRFFSEEEWLKGELRKAELRRKLADLAPPGGAVHSS